MWGSRVLEVAVGLSFAFALLSMISSWLQEQLAAWLDLRARTLEEGIRGLLGSEEARRAVYAHPLIAGLRGRGIETGGERRAPRPSYIPAWMFAEAVFDVVAPASGRSETLKRAIATGELAAEHLDLKPEVLAQVRARVERGERDVAKARRKVERWFDDAMDRASGWYKRRIRWFVLGIAAVLVLVLNVDALAMTQHFWIAGAPAVEGGALGVDRLGALPLGWVDANGAWLPPPATAGAWLTKVLGWLASMIAISLGAPFWFDALNRIVKLRLSGASPVPSSEQPTRLEVAPEPIPRIDPNDPALRLPAIAPAVAPVPPAASAAVPAATEAKPPS